MQYKAKADFNLRHEKATRYDDQRLQVKDYL